MHDLEEDIDDIAGTPEGEPTLLDAALIALLDLEGDAEAVLLEEVNRIMQLAASHYGRVTTWQAQRCALVGFLQGATFATAARQLDEQP
jgi:hypothetical protein